MYQGYDEVEGKDGFASDMSFALEYILRTGWQSESLDSFGPVRSRSCGVSHSRNTYYRSESNSCASFTMIVVWWAIVWLYKRKYAKLEALVCKANWLWDFEVVEWHRRGLQREKSCLRDSSMRVTSNLMTVSGEMWVPIHHAVKA